MKSHFLEKETIISKPLPEVFDFFSKAENLENITPPQLSFSILTPLPIEMKVGTLIDYKIKLMGIPFRWRTRITVWEPPYRFVDEQLKGPYEVWIHEHTFKEVNGKVVMNDKVEFRSPGWILEPIINKIFVESKVKEIFSFRDKALAKWFGKP